MFNKSLTLFVIGLLASGSVFAADLKIGAVNVMALMQQSPQGERAKKEMKDMEGEFGKRGKKLEAEQKEIITLQERLQKDGSVMSESERDKLEKDIISKNRELRRAFDEAQQDANLRKNEVLGRLQKEIMEAVQSLAKDEGYDLIVGDGVLYATSAIDLTSKVESRLGGVSGGGAPARSSSKRSGGSAATAKEE
ncbi:OmpH family outer membrane protein [Candidatus Methylospira mobilis]|uniref:OmpH family outer membrane protein n=1 Tax=Candidatus Methylospira mobilis TaxID=1808979 RepID=A0A5Q0BJF1_9GAMM|nr:OmpH family outer membrane protein [Candidatus Methylospira mobilis]QFY44005.1 OmpH family outer membrane protein [Candidatus Methylospira mobilis]WNV05009.1 OmpH family outer membrane protein [Candidatus Methylospira mobilis]